MVAIFDHLPNAAPLLQAQLSAEPGQEEKKSRLSISMKQLEAQIKASQEKYHLLQQRNLAELR